MDDLKREKQHLKKHRCLNKWPTNKEPKQFSYRPQITKIIIGKSVFVKDNRKA